MSRTTFALAGLAISFCALACAQEVSGDRIVIPSRNSTRPRMVSVKIVYGSVTVKTHGGSDVIVEGSTGRRGPDTYQGLRRIDMPNEGLEVSEQDNNIRIHSASARTGSITVTVPVDTSLQLVSTHGAISVEGVHGDVDASTVHSNVTLTNVSGTVLANSVHGNIKVSMDSVDPSKPLSFATVHGDIDVTLPSSVRLNVKASTTQGAIYSDFEIRLTGGTQRSNNNGMIRIDAGNTIAGTINGGGAEASFRTVHGKVLLRKK